MGSAAHSPLVARVTCSMDPPSVSHVGSSVKAWQTTVATLVDKVGP